MRVAFRVDSSNLIGAGHLTRCLKLAADLKKKSYVVFVILKFKGNVFIKVPKKYPELWQQLWVIFEYFYKDMSLESQNNK